MKRLLTCIALIVLFSLSACQTVSPPEPIGPDAGCVKPQQGDPVDGGLGGTGALDDEDCASTDPS